MGAAADRREVGASGSGVLHLGSAIAGLCARRNAVAPFPRRSPTSLFTRALPPYSLSLPPGMEPCAAWSPRGGRGTATLPFQGFQQSRGGVGTAGRGEGGGPPARGLPQGTIPGPRSLRRAATPAMETPAGFPPPSTLAKLRLGFPPPAKAESSFRPGGGWGWGRRRESSLCGQHPSTRRGQSVGALRVSSPGAVRTGGFVGAGEARGPARTALGEEAELCALESESPARFGSETTCSCSYLPAPPRE